MLLKGDISINRSSLLDIFDKSSWIKKSNYEGIFNAFIFVVFMMLVLMPLENYALYGKFIDDSALQTVFSNTPFLFTGWLGLFSYSLIAFGVQKVIVLVNPSKDSNIPTFMMMV